MQEAQQRFPGLILSDAIEKVLIPQPFSRLVVERIFVLLQVLQKLVEETDAGGQLSQSGLTLINDYFVSQKAWFSGSSSTEEQLPKFRKAMTFPDPINPARPLFCPWHGKIKTPQFRIHFEWPRPTRQREIKVVYIGPKLTKK